MKYGVLGAGMQGVAGAFDLAKFGNAEEVYLSDASLSPAQQGADHINKLLGKKIVRAFQLEVQNKGELKKFLEPLDAIMSAVPYYLNPMIASLCVQTKTHFNDLGGDTPTVQKELELDQSARMADVSIIPDCGVMPGMGNHFAVHGIQQLDKTREVQVRCGGLPQHPKPPLGYKLVFSIEGLLNNYFGKAWILRNGKVTEVDTFDGLEEIDFPLPIGKAEAFTTTGATSTCPWTFEGKVDTWEYKTVRYPGHYEKILSLRSLGFLDTTPVIVKGISVIPQDVACAVIPPKITFPDEPDLIVLRTIVMGTKDGKEVELQYEVLDFQDPVTGFSAMARCTAFSAGVITIMMAHRETPAGAIPLEKSVNQEKYIQELKRRGIQVTQRSKILRNP
ncbi:MAG TPA: saccharopine dehydrogenase C-terminal domain-containing protein [Bdellovibrionota bacterium]|nr:saccharopine dehydrogenase C-terminal domain-containing protein [Bdellovibrionota bacterium]